MADTQAHKYSSFEYKVTNKLIKDVLDKRSELNNTVQLGMPFIKATTTIQHTEYLGEGNVGFTLGLHATDSDIRFEDIFSSRETGGDYPLVGYTYTREGKNKIIYAKPPDIASGDIAALLKLFDQNTELITNPSGTPVRMPPPGITRMTIGRNKNGLLASGQIEISVPTLSQLEFLHRVFLIPGMGMVLEWGYQYANEKVGQDPDFGEGGVTQQTMVNNMFPWYSPDKRASILNRLADRKVGMEEILNCYVYPTQGQYMWMFGRIANFSVKSNTDGSFDVSVKIVGPSEDAWAYSTKATVLPPRDGTGPESTICVDGSNSVESYFSKTAPGLNLKTLLTDVYSGKLLPAWRNHVQYIPNGNKKGGEPEKDEKKPNTSEKSFAESEDAYFMSWKFFVNVVLNHPGYGVIAIFNKTLPPNALQKIAILNPYYDGPERNVFMFESPGREYIDDPHESFVGYNQYLRSTDPSTLVIINEPAVVLAEQSLGKNRVDPDARPFFAESEIAKKFLNEGCGQFNLSTSGFETPQASEAQDKGFLSAGIWLNHRAVAECMLAGDTLLRGVSNLLERMNSATRGYWQLILDPMEPTSYVCSGGSLFRANEKQTWTVVDANYRANADEAVKNLLGKIHVFNKLGRNKNGVYLGSDVTECTVDLSLPKLMFSQIATMGLVQPQDLQAAGVDVTTTTQERDCSVATISDPNEALRRMFSITSLSTKNQNGQGPDVTIKPLQPRAENTCGKVNLQTTAEAGGVGAKTGDVNAATYQGKTTDELVELEKKQQEFLNSENCKKCEQCTPTTTATTSPNTPVALPSDTVTYITDTPWSAGFISYVMQSAGVPFPSAGAHTVYAQTIRQGYSGWQALNPATIPVQVGDVVVQNRGSNRLNFSSSPWAGSSHGDVVTSISGQKVTLVGGNLGDTVKVYTSSINTSGILTSSNFFVVLRPPSGTASRIVASANTELQKWTSNKWKETTPAAFDSLNSYYKAGKLTNSLRGPALVANQTRPVSTVQCTDDVYSDIGGFGTITGRIENGKKICNDCTQAKEQIRQIQVAKEEKGEIASAAAVAQREFPGLRDIFRYYEAFPELMMGNIRCDANGNKSNAFGASPASLALKADLAMPGINGMRIGELFWIDRIPAFYRAFGAFQIMSIEDTIDIGGWQTKIHAQFNYLGEHWKKSILSLTSTVPQTVPTGPITQ